jgi:hypothetical protein
MGRNYKKTKVEIFLSKAHKTAGVDITHAWIHDHVDRSKVAFSDEKPFSIDEPDNWTTYAKEMVPVLKHRRQQGGGSIMMWGHDTIKW